jgi:hypothetical protein
MPEITKIGKQPQYTQCSGLKSTVKKSKTWKNPCNPIETFRRSWTFLDAFLRFLLQNLPTLQYC